MRKRLAPKGPTGLPVLSGLRLPGRGQKILVAVSGGLDSMVLLHTLKAMADERRWGLAVAHFNHHLRGRESDADEAFVRKVAAIIKLPFFAGGADVRQIVLMEKVSTEMGARRLRHEFLARTARQHRMSAIALAHHADDQVELFFLRLLRGAGGSGLGGMQWRSPSPMDSRISLVRPLLDLPRAALEEFAREHRIRYREDTTNRSMDYLRNRIRHELLPLLRRNYQAGLNRTILRSMEIASADSSLVADLAREWLECQGFLRQREKRRGAQPSFGNANFDELPEAIQRQVLKLQIIEFGFTPDFELIESIRLSPAKSVAVAPNDCLSRDSKGCVRRLRPSVPTFDRQTVTVELSEPGQSVFDGLKLNWRVGKPPKRFGRTRRAAGREFFDADSIGKEIVLRHWRAGDRFQPIGLPAAVKLQDLFTNAKVPREKRHQLIVAEARSGIFWVEGLRISEKFKVAAETRRILVWTWWRHGD
ncbi:MAG TPA: tRNA lysidine(34) synthetase TilS [Verrucomicrobiae bacterium]|nr:tRNA lysidine(34) synthetase TilS [Verrucomicrobiae bacterium]